MCSQLVEIRVFMLSAFSIQDIHVFYLQLTSISLETDGITLLFATWTQSVHNNYNSIHFTLRSDLLSRGSEISEIFFGRYGGGLEMWVRKKYEE